MIQKEMIRLSQPTTLQKIFSQLTEGKNKLMIWQNSSQFEGRIRNFIRVGTLNLDQQEMTIYPMKGEFVFSPHSYVYFLGYNRTTIFKASILYHSRFKLVIRLPQEIMMTNSRSGERNELEDEDEESALEYCYNPHQNSEQIFYHAKLTDLSTGGFSFKSSTTNILRFRKGNYLWFKTPLRNNDLLEGQIRHVTKIKDSETNEHFLKVGVQILG